MGVTNGIIVIEDRLQELFDCLLTYSTDGGTTNYSPTFKYGDVKELDTFLKLSENAKSPYPLIWLVYPYIETHKKTTVELQQVSLIIAVNAGTNMLNEQRMKETFKKLLIPVCEDIITLFTRANIMNFPRIFDLTKYPNYSNESSDGETSKTICRWDALKFTFDCTLNGVCFRKITL